MKDNAFIIAYFEISKTLNFRCKLKQRNFQIDDLEKHHRNSWIILILVVFFKSRTVWLYKQRQPVIPNHQLHHFLLDPRPYNVHMLSTQLRCYPHLSLLHICYCRLCGHTLSTSSKFQGFKVAPFKTCPFFSRLYEAEFAIIHFVYKNICHTLTHAELRTSHVTYWLFNYC